MVTGVILFIQSAYFASTLKGIIARYVPKESGIEADFTDLSVHFLPPGLSVRNPRIHIRRENFLKLPPDSSVQADRIDFKFLPLQMFSGHVRVSEVGIVRGNVRLSLAPREGEKPKKRSGPLKIRWDELLQVRADAFSLQDTRVHIEGLPDVGSNDLTIPYLKLGQWKGDGLLGYELLVELNGIQGDLVTKFPYLASIWRTSATAHLNSQSVDLDTLTVIGDGFDANASGKIRGNVLERTGLSLEGNLNLNGDIGKIMAVVAPEMRKKFDASGSFAYLGKIKADDLTRVSQTFKAEGRLTGRSLIYREWKFDELELEGGYNAGPSGGELKLAKAVVTSKETERELGRRAGGGGKISIGAFTLPIGSKSGAPVQIPLTFERAHIHWLAAPALKKVYPLDLRLTGPVALDYYPSFENTRKWALKAKLGLAVENFGLDNQHLGKSKPLHRVLKIPKFRLDGSVLANGDAVMPQDLVVSIETTRIQLGGKIDYKAGFDLTGVGVVKLDEIGEIAENEIKGNGTLSAHIHGPGARVILDFDTNLQDASYLHMNLGDLRGRITWDDDPNKLLFTGLHLAKGKTQYHGGGKIDLDGDGPGTIDMNVDIDKGDIQDLIQVLDHMVKDISWFPRSLNGDVRGKVSIGGEVNLSGLKVAADLAGERWEYLGERVRNLSLKGGYDRGKYYLADVQAIKRSGGFSGRISFDANRKFDWAFQTDAFQVSDLDHVSRLDIPLRGKLSVTSTGSGAEHVTSNTSIVASEVALRGRPMPSSELTIKSENGVLRVSGSAMGGQGSGELLYDFKPGGESTLKGELKQFDFTPAILLFNPSLLHDGALAGVVSGAVNLKFRSGAVERANGSLSVSEYLLAKSGTRFHLLHPVSAAFKNGDFVLDDLALAGPSGVARFSLRGANANLEGAVSGDLDVSIVEFVTSTIPRASGLAHLNYEIGGPAREPLISGRTEMDGATAEIASIESPLENITGTVQLRQNVITVNRLECDLAGGRASAEGTIKVFADRFPEIALKGNLGGNKIKVFPFQYAKTRGTLALHGNDIPYLIDGNVLVESALITEKVFQKRQGDGLKVVQYAPAPTSRTESTYPKFKLNIDAQAERGVLIKNDLFVAEAKGQVKLVNTLEAPRVLGTAEFLPGSKLVFKDREFLIQSASGTFDSPTVINPLFNMTATTDVNGTKIQLYAAGRLNNWKPDLSSNPPMPEPEILSLLATGLTSNEARKFSAGDRSVVEQGEAASLLLNSLDFNREVQNKTGFQIQLDESVNNQQGTSAFRPQTSNESAAAPKIVIRKQIGERIGLSAGSTVGVGTNTQKEVNAEFRLNQGLSVIGVWDNYEAIDTQDRTSMGLDLKWQKRFK